MVETTVSVVIHKSPAEVARVMADIEKLPLWNVSVEEARHVKGNGLAVGDEIMQRWLFLGKRIEAIFRVTEFELNKKLVLVANQPMPLTYDFTLTEIPEGTRLTFKLMSAPGGFFKVVGPVLNSAVRRNAQMSLENLKELVEEPVPAHA